MANLGRKTEDYQPETVYQEIVDEDEEDDIDGEESQKNDLRDSFRTTLVKFVDKFIGLFHDKNKSNPKSLVMPQEQWDFIVQLVQDNKAGSPDNQTAISNLIEAATTKNGEDEEAEKQQKKKSTTKFVSATKNRAKPGGAQPKTLDEVLDW